MSISFMKQMRLLLPLLFLVGAAQGQAPQTLTRQQEKNLVAFARIFGYVRYFHPSDEAQTISWPMLATKGSRQMLAVQDDAELIRALNNLFLPLGPTIRVFPTSQPVKFDPATLQPPATARATKVVSWQHQGLYTGKGKAYQSIRLNRPGTAGSTTPLAVSMDASAFAGQPYEVDLSWRRGKNSPKATFTITHRQLLGGTENSRATQRLLNQTVATAGNHYRFSGRLDSAAQRLDLALGAPAGFEDSLNVTISAIVKGKKVKLNPAQGGVDDMTDKQTVEIDFTSPDLLVEPLFKEQSRLGDYVTREVVPGISCIVPLALAGNATHTYPLGDLLQLNAMHIRPADRQQYPAEWARYQGDRTIGLPEVRLANVVEAWNAMRHGYAYWGSAAVPPDTLLHQTLRRAYRENSTMEFQRTLELMTAALNDGHAWAMHSSYSSRHYTVPAYLGKVEGQIVVLQVLTPRQAPQLRRGDIVLTIDGVAAEKVLQDQASRISGSPQNKEFRALLALGDGPKDKPATLTLRRGDSTLTVRQPRTMPTPNYQTGSLITAQRPNGWLAPGIYYYNLATMPETLSPTEFQILAQAKAVIFDIRNYPGNGVYSLIPMLLKAPAETTITYNLDMLRPDQENIRYSPNVVRKEPSAQHLAGKMYFLTDVAAQSHPETFLGLLRGFHLGTFVGRPTSGANGGVSYVPLQSGFSVSYSGMLVKNADGSRHHAIGIQPDVLVTPTLESVRQGQDLILETALELAKSGK
jgi:C-terminal processing protease CtpA/Prc